MAPQARDINTLSAGYGKRARKKPTGLRERAGSKRSVGAEKHQGAVLDAGTARQLADVLTTAEVTLASEGLRHWRRVLEAMPVCNGDLMAFWRARARGERMAKIEQPQFLTLDIAEAEETVHRPKLWAIYRRLHDGERYTIPAGVAATAALAAEVALDALQHGDAEDAFWAGVALEQYRLVTLHPELGLIIAERARWHRSRVLGARHAARKHHENHIDENVEPYRKEYRERLKAARRETHETFQRLSAPIISAMAERDGKPVKWMRDTIKPHQIWKELRAM